jgi:hypothetical protein
MTIVRTFHDKQNPFVILNKLTLWDKELSLGAVGLWARLLSRPDDWVVSVTELAKSCSCSKKIIYRLLNELVTHGYAVRYQTKQDSKKSQKKKVFGGMETHVFERKMSEEEIKEMFPQLHFAHADDPLRGKGNTTNIDSTKKEKKTNTGPTRITLNSEARKFEGISEDDLKTWQATFPAVNIRKELQEAVLWALNTPRKNYRRSLDVWMSNVNKAHTTPFQAKSEEQLRGTEEEARDNKAQGDSWEDEYSRNPQMNYGVQSSPLKITFILPNNAGYSVDYSLTKQEFLKLCQPATKRMNLPI